MRMLLTRTLLPAALAALSLAALPAPAPASTCPNAGATPSAGNMRALKKATLCLLNRERKRRGLRSLRDNSRLQRAARAHSADMVANDYFSHVSLNGTDLVGRLVRADYVRRDGAWAVGENIAYGTGTLAAPRVIAAGWMRSPGHRANILNRGFRDIGIGIVHGVPGPDESSGATYTSDFGNRG
jgi:uncharacterized protein YkwD